VCIYIYIYIYIYIKSKSKGVPRQAEVAQGVPGRLMPRIFLTFRHYTVVGRQPNAPAAITPGEIPGTHFQRLIYIRVYICVYIYIYCMSKLSDLW